VDRFIAVAELKQLTAARWVRYE